MDRWRAAAVGVACRGSGRCSPRPPLFCAGRCLGSLGPGTPSRGLVDGQGVTVSGRGLPRTYAGKPLTWFVAECTATVQGRMNPSTDTPHCDVTEARAIRLSSHDTFSTRFHVETGIVGDGYCGSNGHNTCVISVGNARGQGTVVRITFRDPVAAPASTTTTTTTTATPPSSSSSSPHEVTTP